MPSLSSVLERVRQQHPDMKNVVNQGYGLANARPELVDGVETEVQWNIPGRSLNINPGW